MTDTDKKRKGGRPKGFKVQPKATTPIAKLLADAGAAEVKLSSLRARRERILFELDLEEEEIMKGIPEAVRKLMTLASKLKDEVVVEAVAPAVPAPTPPAAVVEPAKSQQNGKSQARSNGSQAHA